MTTYYITKYALSVGIKQVDEEGAAVFTDGAIKPHGQYNYYHLGRDAFDNEPDAKAHAEKMHLAKIESLKRQTKKLEALKF